MTQVAPYAERWGFLLDQLCQEQADISHAVAVAGDGLLLASSAHLPRDQADHIAAVTSGLASLTTGAARLFDVEPVEQVVVDMNGGHLVIMAIDSDAILTVLAVQDADMGRVAYEMAQLINRSGEIFIPAQRSPM